MTKKIVSLKVTIYRTTIICYFIPNTVTWSCCLIPWEAIPDLKILKYCNTKCV